MTTPMSIVNYYRVSSKKQGRSGLGLEAQRAAAEVFVKQHPGCKIVGEYQEVESGKRADNRPQLALALSHCKLAKAVLLVAKLDRLSRNAHFVTGLQQSGVKFICCDNEGVNDLTIGLLAIIAQEELKAISARTKASLAMAKERGVLLGSARPGHWADEGRQKARLQGLAKGRTVAADVHRKAANDAYGHLYSTMLAMRSGGASLRQIAARLNELGHATRRSKSWNATQVLLVLRRAATFFST